MSRSKRLTAPPLCTWPDVSGKMLYTGNPVPNANSSPSDFVNDLTNPGLWIVPMSKWVSLANYLCPVYGGNDEAKMLANAIPKIVKGSGDETLISGIDSEDYDRVFKGQGKPSHISMIMHLIWYPEGSV